jgi:hypothetical protein
MWTSLIHNARLDGALRKEQIPIQFWTIRRSQRGSWVDEWTTLSFSHHYFLMLKLCAERHYLRLRWNVVGCCLAPKTKIIVLVDTVLIGRSIGGVISWNSGIQSCQAIIHALPFTIMASHVPTIFILVSIQREKGEHMQWAHLSNAMAA